MRWLSRVALSHDGDNIKLMYSRAFAHVDVFAGCFVVDRSGV